MKKDFIILTVLIIILLVIYFILQKTDNNDKTIIYYSLKDNQKQESKFSHPQIRPRNLNIEIKKFCPWDTNKGNTIIIPIDSSGSFIPFFVYQKKDVIKNPVLAENISLIVNNKIIPISLISPYSIYNVILKETSQLPKESFPLKIGVIQKFTPALILFLEEEKEESYQILIPQGNWVLPWYKKDSFVIINPLEVTNFLKIKVFKDFSFLREEKILLNYQRAINDILQPLMNEKGYYEIFIESSKTLNISVKELTTEISNHSSYAAF